MEEYISVSLGAWKFAYYVFCSKFHLRPTDIDDLVDGLLYLELRQIAEERELARIKREQEKK